MLSMTLVQMIEDHADEISHSVIGQIRRDVKLSALHTLADWELEGKALRILKNLGHWLEAKDPEVQRWCEELGRHRFDQSVPLHELVRSFLLIKRKMIDFVREKVIDYSSVQIYAKEELEHQVSVFFDDAVYHLVKGYEQAEHASPTQRTAPITEISSL